VTPKPDSQLLLAYAERRSEAAFTELVRRHVDLVHSAALRITNDPHLAKDVAQGVFAALARQAGSLAGHGALVGWLHRTTRNIAAHSIRTESRRRMRERQAAAMNQTPDSGDSSWQQIAPFLDAALADLATADRDAILLRYFENKSAREVADQLAISTEAAQKRVNRAVERLRENFAKRGITASAAGLAGTISSHAVQAAPPGLAALVSTSALTGAAIPAGAIKSIQILFMTTTGKALLTATAAILAAWVAHHVLRPGGEAGQASAAPPPTLSDAKMQQSASPSERAGRSRNGELPVISPKDLASLRQRWDVVGAAHAKDGLVTDEYRALAKETAEVLLCGEEAIELIRYLEAHGMENAALVLEEGISLHLRSSPAAAEARRSLVGMSSKANTEAYMKLIIWSNAAGEGCPVDEFEAFHASLENESCAQEALFGRNKTLMQTDPEAAIRSALQASLDPKIHSITWLENIKLLFWVELPDDLDFAKLEQLLPPDRPGGHDPVALGRRDLIFKWGERDPAAAANHVMAHPHRLDVNLISQVVRAYAYKDAAGAAQWVADFPEGPYYDVAASSAARFTTAAAPLETEKLVLKIEDPKLRVEALETLKEKAPK
jgi:RNA polymerase sigma factor (sigma-70 family)